MPSRGEIFNLAKKTKKEKKERKREKLIRSVIKGERGGLKTRSTTRNVLVKVIN